MESKNGNLRARFTLLRSNHLHNFFQLFILAENGCPQRAIYRQSPGNEECRHELSPTGQTCRSHRNFPSFPFGQVNILQNHSLNTFAQTLNTFSRIQNLDSIVKPEDRDLPITNLRGDVLYNSWNSIFNAQGGFFTQAPRIYSFSGKNILNDNTW